MKHQLLFIVVCFFLVNAFIVFLTGQRQKGRLDHKPVERGIFSEIQVFIYVSSLENVSFLQNRYQPSFPHLHFLSSEYCFSLHDILMYTCFMQADVERGMLFFSENTLVQPDVLLRLNFNLNKIWVSLASTYETGTGSAWFHYFDFDIAGVVLNETIQKVWPPWLIPYIIQARMVFSTLPSKYQLAYVENLQTTRMVHSSLHEFFYIPKQLVKDFLQLIEILHTESGRRGGIADYFCFFAIFRWFE